MLYDNIDEVIDIRNYITFRIGKLTRDKIKSETREKYRLLEDEYYICNTN